MTTQTTQMGDYTDALQSLPAEWERQDVTNVKMCVSKGKFILACADYPPIIFDKGRWKVIKP